MTRDVDPLRKTWAMRRERGAVTQYWTGARGWTPAVDAKAIKRYVSPQIAIRMYDRHFAAYGYPKPDAEPVDIGPSPSVVCICGKRRFSSEHEATNVLLAIWRRIGPRGGGPRAVRRREQRAYECDRAPGTWHLTGQERA